MKTLKRYLLCLLPFLTDACKNPIDGIQLGFKDPITQGVLELRLIDPAGKPLPKQINVKLAGPDASRIVTTLNTNRYKVNADGILLLAASPQSSPSAQQPLRFTVVLESEGYLPVVQPVVMTSLNRQVRTVRFINIPLPPATLSAELTAGRAGTDGALTTTLTLDTPLQSGKVDNASLTLPMGTKLTDRDGQAVSGELAISLVHTDTRSGNATAQVPGGGLMNNVMPLIAGSQSLGLMRVSSMGGSVTIEAYNEQYQLARSFSQPVRLTMELNPAMRHPQADRTIRAGDVIPLFSFDALTSVWRQEKPGVVVLNQQTGRLEYQADVLTAGTFVVGWADSICEVGPVFSVSSKLKNVDVNYRCEIVDAVTGQLAGSFYASANDGAQIRITAQPRNRRLKLRVFDETDAWGKGTKGGLIAESAVGTSCDVTPVSLNLGTLPVPPPMKLEFQFSCPKGMTLDEAALPAILRTQYSEAGKNNWRELVTLTRTQRNVTSYKLKQGRKYDLRASTDGGASWPYRQNEYLLDKAQWVFKVRLESYCK
ncbi:hypothetical protein BN8_02421 [Fibrisoma limi BUZ 3]|uniref:Uncharacterized protein n=1 Tax=Fibrisoma limi BUZ 3 TaxID=1185876 RepID=I2GHF6_9BACT|nr:hypothetical protein [Fibrisoma limi]CCH53331.1 hypothetical protein BN8_02421 [Fibrisoma limi BUZ 3]